MAERAWQKRSPHVFGPGTFFGANRVTMQHPDEDIVPGLLRALFFGEKCATCVQICGVRWSSLRVRSICCVSIKYELLFYKSRQISINIM